MTVEIAKTEDVWTIIHNRPEARNAMDPESADNLVDAFNEFNKSDAKVGVFYGEGNVVKIGKSIGFAESILRNENEEEVAAASATFRIFSQ